MFSMCKMTALHIRRRISPPRAPNSSFIASSTSLDHPPRTFMTMLYCWMSYLLGTAAWVPADGAMLGGLLFLILFSVLWPRAAHFYHHNTLLLMIYKSRIHSVLPHLLTYCKDWNVPICLGLGWLVFGFGSNQSIPRWHQVREPSPLSISQNSTEGCIVMRKVLILCKCRATRQHIRDTFGSFATKST